ncbi:hypothetical protein CDL12_23893 [Handroanthus impetiginosus]|uniref:Uncharacterized protein n=1 Tax=Handroanthus impetiginosus TaxID=429701 RepID=A0A2G9GE64_9LAMI|nr:hypothetical protein CDL12_23893 [Handroanthus impetiginosus]
METILFRHGSLDQSISPYKSHIRNPDRINYSFISGPSDKFLPSSEFHRSMGLLQAPPPFLYRSYPPYSPQQPPQPPLLPLPAAKPYRSASVRVLPANRKTNNGYNRARDSSLTPKKSKSPPKQEIRNSPKKPSDVTISSTNPLGPDPKELPKDVQKVLPLISSGNNSINTNNVSSVKIEEDNDQVDTFSGSVTFTISPPPSSLPLPTFSLRPKLSCKAEAAGIDTGATDNLRRLLRLQ